jgi:type I restriction enzyme M protein
MKIEKAFNLRVEYFYNFGDIMQMSESNIEKNIERGISEGIIELLEDKSRITYKASRRYSTSFRNPEEKVRASYFVELVLDYGYPKEKIDFEVLVPRRTPSDRADIIVFEDNELKKPFIVVECKREGITDAEFEQAVEQLFGNANSLKAKYGIIIAGLRRRAFNIADFPPLEREKNIISDIPIKYGKPIKYRFKKGGTIFEDLKIVSKEELIKILEKVHDTVWQGGKLAPTTAFDEVSKLMFCKIWDEKTTRKEDYYKFQIGSNESAKDVFDRINSIYGSAKKKDPRVFTEDIKLSPEVVFSVVEQLQEVNFTKTDLDTKGVAFERFMEDFFKGKMGQYFTPREIIEFMVEFAILHFDEDEYLNLKVLDPACGSGGFLLHILDFIRKWSEKNYDDREASDHWHEFAKRNIYGIEINEQIARVCKMNMILHDDGHTNVISFDALEDFSKIEEEHKDFKKDSFDLILTNPPFGAVIKKSEREYIKNYELGEGKIRQKTEILFIERCWEFLRNEGILGIIIPDGILTNSSLQYVRDFILDRFKVLAVISIPNFAFTHYGAGVKSSLVFLQKKEKGKDLGNYSIYLADVKHIGYDATGRNDKNNLKDILKERRESLKTYRLKKNLNFERFIVYKNELEGRLDVYYYTEEFRELEKKLKECGVNIVKLKDVCIRITDGSHYSPKSGDNFKKNYITVKDLDDFGNIDIDNCNKISDEEYNKLIKRGCKPSKDDVLFSKDGTIGKTYLVNENDDFVVLSSLAILTPDKDKIIPKYLEIILSSNIVLSSIKRAMGGSALRRIILDNLKNIKIPLPPKEIQEKIVRIIEDAYKLKKQKEKDAENLLNSIDEYILNELSIKIPEIKEKNSFIVNVEDILKNKRLDVEFNKEKYRILMDAIEKGKYETVEVGKALNIQQGHENIKKYDFINYVDLSLIDDNIGIIKDFKLLKSSDAPSRARQKIEKNDLLVATLKGSLKSIAVFEDENIKNPIASTGFIIIKNSEKYNTYYLHSLFRTEPYQKLLERITTGAVMPAIDKNEFKKLKIPLPPKEIQEKIAKEVRGRIKKAQQLKEESKKTIEDAKKEVEKIFFERWE